MRASPENVGQTSCLPVMAASCRPSAGQDAPQTGTPQACPTSSKPFALFALYMCIFLLLFSCYAYVHQDYSGGTSVSRLDLLQALVRDGTFAIDRYHGNTSDKAKHDGHYYTDKAPGTVAAALPAFAFGTLLESPAPGASNRGFELGYGSAWLVPSWIGTAGSVGLITALGGVFFFAWLRWWMEPKYALAATLALFLGAMPFTYATMLFSHGMVAGLIAIALWAIEKSREQDARNDSGNSGFRRWVQSRRWDLLAGFCCGWVLASEFPAGLIVGGIFVWLALRDWRQAARFSLGAIPPLLLIPAYSLACFGTPWTIGYAHHSTFREMHLGLCGIGLPNAKVAWKYLVPPERGLVFWSPWFLMAAPGWLVLWRRERSLFWLTFFAPLALTVVMSGYAWDWRAGWTLGPRYLCPMLPLLALPAALGTQRFPRVGLTLAALSILLTGVGTLVNATPRYEITNPLMELHLPGLIKGELTYNLGRLCGLPGLISLAPLLAMAVVYLWLIWLAVSERKSPEDKCQQPLGQAP